MKFMVIETFKDGKRPLVYERFREKGRMLPYGLTFIDSWVELDGNRCFQVMETENEELFDVWTAKWSDLVDFEVVPVIPSPTKQSTN